MRNCTIVTSAALSIVIVLSTCAFAAPPADESAGFDDQSIRTLRVQPASIRLDGKSPAQQLLVTATLASGRQVDVSGRCRVEVDDARVAVVAGSLARAVGEGKTHLRVSAGSIERRVSVVVTQIDEFPPVHFADDVVPIFSKLGCNSGSCHGKQSGQNGFRLAVFGSDVRADYEALVKEARGRRLFPAAPERSLLIRKATGEVAHGGGSRTEPGGDDARLLAEWVRQGMPWGEKAAPRLVDMHVAPAERIMDKSAKQQVLVTAIYSDGTRRDVTSAAAYTSNAKIIADVEADGLVHTGRLSGEAAITINYMGQVAAVRILVPRGGAPSPYPKLPTNNKIDTLVWAKLEKMGLLPSEAADDATFLRRLHLDAIGTLPTADEVRRFLTDKRPERRSRAIDAVLARDQWADYWALKWADILLVDRDQLGERGAYQLHRWLREQFARNRPYDQWVRELLTATGNSGKYGPVNFYRALRTPEELTTSVSQAFLGVRLDCAQCHHHPFDQWAQEDFFGMAGFFTGLERKTLTDDRELVFYATHKPARIPVVDRIVDTKPLGGKSPKTLSDGDPRVHLARWMTDPANPWFSRLVANRLWKHFLGRGLVEPEDDLRLTNPATNEPLLAHLESEVVAGGYDLKAVMRQILNSRVYQLSSEANETNVDDLQNFSRYYVKRMPAEVLLDAICQATGSPERFVGMPAGTRSIQLWDNRLPSYFLDTFGRSERTSPCECGKSSEPTMAQALHLMNAPEIETKLSDPAGRVAALFGDRKRPTRDDVARQLCLAALGREPNEKEKKVAKRLMGEGPSRATAEDYLWTLLNSYDFLFIK